MFNFSTAVEVNTKCEMNLNVDVDGLASIPVDISNEGGSLLTEIPFYTSTGSIVTTMKAETLRQLGYDVDGKDAVIIPVMRLGYYDFNKTSVIIGSENILGANILKSLEFSFSYTEKTFVVDLSSRLKSFVQKGLNPTISPMLNSRLKSSKFNDMENWFMWNEIDNRFPNAWVLLWGGDDEVDCGGEVLWSSETEIPETIQDNTFLYCNKSVATEKPFNVSFEESIRLRSFSSPDKNYEEEINRLEALLVTPTINRFYYDIISKQGKVFLKDKVNNVSSKNASDGVLTQKQIDDLLQQMLG